MKTPLTVVKIGGNVIDNPDLLSQVLSDFVALEGAKILVHGGGKLATQLSANLGIESRFHLGRRITSLEELKMVTMVYAGWINKSIVAQLHACGASALGLCGADGDALRSKKRENAEVDFGYVGDVGQVHSELIAGLLNQQIVPVFSAITHDGNGGLLNTNADTVASEIAKAMSAEFSVKLIYCFDKQGVLSDEKDDDSVLPLLSKTDFELWKQDGALHSGILPKIQNCLAAKESGVAEVYITHALNLNLTNLKTSFQ